MHDHHPRHLTSDSHTNRPHVSRRDFLASIIGAGWAGLTLIEASVARAALARAQSPGAATNLFTIEKVGDGLYAALARPATFINSNAAIFVGAEDVLVVDTHSKPSAAASLIAQIKKEVTPKPVRYVVNSHFHWDHMQGNSAYRQAFPKVDFLASEPSKKLMAAESAARLKKQLAELPAQIEATRANLSKAKDAREKEFYSRMLAEQEAYAKEMARWTLEPPTRTFDKELVLRDKAHTLHLAFHGRAHTAGDVTVFCPEKKAIATGDMIHGFLPYIADAYPREWPKTIDAVGKLGFDFVLPGHGPVHRDRVRLRHMRDYIEELAAKVAEGKKAGKSAAELQKTITRQSLRSLQTDNYEGLIRQTLRQATPLLGEPAIDQNVATNVLDTYNTIDKK